MSCKRFKCRGFVTGRNYSPMGMIVLRCIAFLIPVLAVAAPRVQAAEVVVQNDALAPGDPGFLVNPFQVGESVAAWLTAPVDGQVVAVQIVWRSGSGGAPASQEDSLTIFEAGTFPDPGAALAVIEDPVLTDGDLNEFRHLDGAMTMPLNVPVTAGQTFIVSLKFTNSPADQLEGPGIAADFGDCLSGGYSSLSVDAEPDDWVDLCARGFPGNLAIRAVIDKSAVPTVSAWGAVVFAGLLLAAGTITIRRWGSVKVSP